MYASRFMQCYPWNPGIHNQISNFSKQEKSSIDIYVDVMIDDTFLGLFITLSSILDIDISMSCH